MIVCFQLRERVEQLLNQQDIPLSNLKRTLTQYVAMMGDADDSSSAAASSSSSEEDPVAKTKRVLVALASMLE